MKTDKSLQEMAQEYAENAHQAKLRFREHSKNWSVLAVIYSNLGGTALYYDLPIVGTVILTCCAFLIGAAFCCRYASGYFWKAYMDLRQEALDAATEHHE